MSGGHIGLGAPLVTRNRYGAVIHTAAAEKLTAQLAQMASQHASVNTHAFVMVPSERCCLFVRTTPTPFLSWKRTLRIHFR